MARLAWGCLDSSSTSFRVSLILFTTCPCYVIREFQPWLAFIESAIIMRCRTGPRNVEEVYVTLKYFKIAGMKIALSFR